MTQLQKFVCWLVCALVVFESTGAFAAGEDWPFPKSPNRVKIVDQAGSALGRFYVQELNLPDSNGVELPFFHNLPYRTQSTVVGWHVFGESAYAISAEGKASAWFGIPREGDDDTQVVLKDGADAVVTIRDADGKPLIGQWILPLSLAEAVQDFDFLLQANDRPGMRSDEHGRAHLIGWPEGRHAFVTNPMLDRSEQILVEIAFRPGHLAEIEIEAPPWREGMVHSLVNKFATKNLFSDAYTDATHPGLQRRHTEQLAQQARAVAMVTPDIRPQFQEAIHHRIAEWPVVDDAHRNNIELTRLVQTAVHFEVPGTAELIRRYLEQYEPDPVHAQAEHPVIGTKPVRWRRNMQFFLSLTMALYELEGEDYVAWLRDTAESDEVDAKIRGACFLTLGVLGTDDSIAAWRELRDAMFQRHPELRGEITDEAERVVESVYALQYDMLGLERSRWDHLPPHLKDRSPVRVTFDENGEQARVSYGISFVSMYTLKRFGEDWVVVEPGSYLQVSY